MRTPQLAGQLQNWGQQMLAAKAFTRLAPRFTAANLPLLPVKGFALGRWVYADLSERGMLDIDLLVMPHQLETVRRVAREADWPIVADRRAIGEITFFVERVAVEAHSALGFPDLCGTEVSDVLSRAALDTTTFGFPTYRIDDLDHFVLLAVNILKNHFHKANPHQPRDLELLWPHVALRLEEFKQRLSQAGFTTGMHAVAEHLVRLGYSRFSELVDALAHDIRRAQSHALYLMAKRPLPRVVAATLICWTNDNFFTRSRCIRGLPYRIAESILR